MMGVGRTIEDRIKRWRGECGKYDGGSTSANAASLLCDAEEELRRLRLALADTVDAAGPKIKQLRAEVERLRENTILTPELIDRDRRIAHLERELAAERHNNGVHRADVKLAREKEAALGRALRSSEDLLSSARAEVDRLQAKMASALLEAASANGDAKHLATEVERLRAEEYNAFTHGLIWALARAEEMGNAAAKEGRDKEAGGMWKVADRITKACKGGEYGVEAQDGGPHDHSGEP